MGYIGSVGASFPYSTGSSLYGTCNTISSTSEKFVECADFSELDVGITIHVRFKFGNTAQSPTLNINNTGSIPIYRYNSTPPGDDPNTSWADKSVISFTYDGTAWIMNDCMNTTYTIGVDSQTEQITLVDSNGYGQSIDVLYADHAGSAESTEWNTINNKPEFGNSITQDYTTSVTEDSSDLITSGAVYTALNNLPQSMVFKGSLGEGGTITQLPPAEPSNAGWTYKVITNGTYAGQDAHVGDTFISNGVEWILAPAGDDTDTWRNIKVNGTEVLGNDISTGSIDFIAGDHTNIHYTSDGHTIQVNADDLATTQLKSLTGFNPGSTSTFTVEGATLSLNNGSVPSASISEVEVVTGWDTQP